MHCVSVLNSSFLYFLLQMNEDITEIQLHEEEDVIVIIGEDSAHSSLLRLYIIFIFMWQSTFKLSDAGTNVLFTNVLFTFIASFLLLLATSQALKDFCAHLPRNIPSARKIAGQTRERFQRWVCCSLYSIENLKTKESDGQVVSRKCEFVRYPDDPQSRHKQPCGAMLLKSVRTSAGCLSPISTAKSILLS